MARVDSSPQAVPPVPAWFPKAGFISGFVTLVFFMYVAAQGADATFAHVIVLALGAALAAGFLGGDAQAKGTLPIPFLRKSPMAFAIASGGAVLVIVLVLGYTLFLRQPRPVDPGPISIAFDKPLALSTVIQMLEKDQNVTVALLPSCGDAQSMGKLLVSAGEHRGDDVQSLLEGLQLRFVGAGITYTVRSLKGVRYEIACN